MSDLLQTAPRIQAIKGMTDILPKEVVYWQKFEDLWRKLMPLYGYEEIRFPIVEATGLFKRSIGEVTDIVEKEMFTFEDRDHESITLRPEGTAGCVRAGLEHGLLYRSTHRLWYMGPMFRYEKPQKGRYRQFHQVGIEAYGFQGPDLEAEQIFLMHRFWRWLGLENSITLQINSLGSKEGREKYRKILVEYFSKHREALDEDSLRRLQTNPLRILDSKNPQLSQIIQEAPKAFDYLNAEDKAHFELFQQLLREAGIAFTVNPCIVRGLDYYNRTVYEWVTPKLGAQNAVCAGGRYDSLVAQLGGEPMPAVGFALGIERVVLLLKEVAKETEAQLSLGLETDLYLIAVGSEAESKALIEAEKLRDQVPDLKILVNCGGGNFKGQFKRADKSGAKIALILGEDELKTGKFGVKFLREEKEQTTVDISAAGKFLNEYFRNK